jgi:hypothetical protein
MVDGPDRGENPGPVLGSAKAASAVLIDGPGTERGQRQRLQT